MLDLTPATDTVARVVTAVRDDQLDGPTPCPQMTVAALLDHLDGLAQAFAAAWQDEGAWTGMTAAGGVDLPGEVAGLVALDEVVVHGWDLARATGQPYDPPPAVVESALGFVTPTVAASPEGTPGLFGPPVAVPDDAPPLHRLLGLTGRDPDWRPAP